MKAFSERNPLIIAVAGILALVLVFLVTFNAERLPIIGGGQVYHAKFAEAAGLKTGDEVRVAGVKVGKVTDVTLDGTQVDVAFRVKDAWIGDQSSAEIKIKSLLGQKFLSLDPSGNEQLDASDAIPMSRTTTPYDVIDAFGDLSTNIDDIDTQQLAKSFEVLSDAFQDTPKSVRDLVDGLSDVSKTISSRDKEIAQLLDATTDISGTLSARKEDIAAVIQDGNLLLAELINRHDAITRLLEGTSRLGTQLEGLVTDNQAQLKPALDQLDRVSTILEDNQGNLDQALKMVGPYYRLIASASGNGRWIDSYVCGLINDHDRPQLDSDVLRNCSPRKGGGQ